MDKLRLTNNKSQ